MEYERFIFTCGLLLFVCFFGFFVRAEKYILMFAAQTKASDVCDESPV